MKKKKPLKLIAILLSFLMIISLLPTNGMTVEAVAKPKLAKKSSNIVIGGTAKIKVKNAPKGAKITYKSARKDIATVSKKGVVKGIKNGSTKITVTLKNKSKTTKSIYNVTVKKPKLSKSKLSLIPGKTAKLSVKSKPMKAKYTWLSSNSQIATVNKSGTVTAKAQGNVTIKVKIKTAKNTYTLQCNVTVKASNFNTDVEPTGITLDRSSASITEGDSLTFTATVMPSNATNKTVTWSSSNTGVANVSSGKVTGVSAGTATITAKTINGKICICEVEVSPKSGQVLDFDKFAQEGAALIKENGDPSGTNIAEDGEFASKRLIVRGKNTQLDFTQFNPKAVIKSNDGIYLIQFASVSATKTALSEISNWPDIEWVELDTYSDVDVADNVSVASKSWGVSKIGADKYADSISSIRDDIVVAVVDTGVSNHAFLSGRIQNGGFDYVDNDSDPSDKHYHGTHVAGTIVDCTPGLNVKILPVRVLNAEGRGSSFNVGNGIKYAADHGAKVINLSLGGSHSNYKDENIEYAINKGVIVVVAAGNENDNTSYSCPAHLNKAIVVAAVDENDRRASFSNYGDSVDIAAPGVGIISCVPGGSYRSLNGTSMATPHVAAVAAMFKLKYPSMTPSQVETMVKENARDLGSTGWDKYYGYGIPNLSDIVSVEPTGITLDQSNVSIKIGGTVTLTATVTPSNATDKTVTWSSNKTSVAKVNNGKVTGGSAGTATITATTSNGKTATCTVDVTPTVVEPTGITLDQSNVSIKIGGTVTLTATVTPGNATDKTVTWSSDKTSVATVNNGKITGVSEGMATITARTSNGKTASCSVKIENNWNGYTKIYTPEDFYNIRNNLSGKFVLMNNIDLSAYDTWTPIGERYNAFKGILEGQGYYLKIANCAVTEYGECGIFGESMGATFNNLILNGKISVENREYICTGGLVGAASSTNINNCINNISITVNAQKTSFGSGSSLGVRVSAGGILGSFTGTIQNCINNGIIKVTSTGGTTSGIFAGGIMGGAVQGSLLKITNCHNTGDVSATANSHHYGVISGGLIGETDYDNIILENCSNKGLISATINNSGNISECSVGGLIGLYWKKNDITIKNCTSIIGVADAGQGTSHVDLEVGYFGGFKVFSSY